MKNFLNTLKTKAQIAETKAYLAWKNGIALEEPGDHLLEVLGTIIIAVVLLVLFKGKITNLFNTALENSTTNVNNLFNNSVVTP